MDGIVVIEMATGTLHFTKAFTRRFERQHPTSERMNLGALLFAFQQVARQSLHPAEEASTSASSATSRGALPPAITQMEVAHERYVFARSQKHGLLLVLIGRRSFPESVARAWIQRLAALYDQAQDTEGRVAMALNQRGRLFHDRCRLALQQELAQYLQTFATRLGLLDACTAADREIRRFVVLYFSTALTGQATHGQDGDAFAFSDDSSSSDRDDRDHDGECGDPYHNDEVRAAASTTRKPSVNRLQRMYSSTRSLLSARRAIDPDTAHGHHHRHKTARNAVGVHSPPATVLQHLCARLPSDPALDVDVFHQQFAESVLQTALPLLTSLSPTKILREFTWRKFPLPAANDAFMSADLSIWQRDGCVVIHSMRSPHSPAQEVRALLDRLLEACVPLARGLAHLEGQ